MVTSEASASTSTLPSGFSQSRVTQSKSEMARARGRFRIPFKELLMVDPLPTAKVPKIMCAAAMLTPRGPVSRVHSLAFNSTPSTEIDPGPRV